MSDTPYYHSDYHADYYNDETAVEEQFRMKMNDKSRMMDMFNSSLEVEETPILGPIKVMCSKHGNLHEQTLLNIRVQLENGDIEEKVYCLLCLTDYLDKLMSGGILPQVKILK
jgi:hypothetical protein